MEAPRSILVVRFSSLGDVLLTTPLLRRMRQVFPDAHIAFLTKPAYAPLVQHNPHLTEVLTLPDDSFRALRRLAKDLRTRRFEAVVDLHTSLRSWYIRRRGGGRTRWTWPRDRLRRRLLITMKRNRYPRPIAPIPERFFDAVAPWSLTPDGLGPDLTIPSHTTRAVDALPFAAKPFPVLAPSAKWETKRWPATHYAVVGRALAYDWNAPVVLLGGAEDMERCAEVAHHIGPDAVNLAGRTDLLTSAAVIARAGVFIGNDTGLTHMAVAVGTPLVALFGCTVEEFGYYPYGQSAPAEVLAVDDLACRPCTKNGRNACPKSHFRCMQDIPPDRVLAAARRAAPPPSAAS